MQCCHSGNLLQLAVCTWAYSVYIARIKVAPYNIHIFNQSTLQLWHGCKYHSSFWWHLISLFILHILIEMLRCCSALLLIKILKKRKILVSTFLLFLHAFTALLLLYEIYIYRKNILTFLSWIEILPYFNQRFTKLIASYERQRGLCEACRISFGWEPM